MTALGLAAIWTSCACGVVVNLNDSPDGPRWWWLPLVLFAPATVAAVAVLLCVGLVIAGIAHPFAEAWGSWKERTR